VRGIGQSIGNEKAYFLAQVSERTISTAPSSSGTEFSLLHERPSVSQFPSGSLQVVVQLDTRFLFNHRDAELKRILLADLLVSSGGASGPFVFPAPVYQIGGLPPRSYTELPSADEKLDGYSLWHIREAKWGDGRTLTEPTKLSERKLWGGATFSEAHVQREVQHLHTEPSRPAILSERAVP